ncbi:MAG: transposase [Chloroflexi bacterium]|nr:transposase [Chloroflexota bacterium]
MSRKTEIQARSIANHSSDNPQVHHRRSIRLKGYDYSQNGLYFLTIGTHQRKNLFGHIRAGINSQAEMALNEYGRLVQYTWDDLPNHIPGIELGAFVIMPNHIHGLVMIVVAGSVGAGSKHAHVNIVARSKPAPTELTPLSEIVRQLKTFSARRINQARHTPGIPVWQRNYWEHIVRSEESAIKICNYIQNNPQMWATDQLNAGFGAGLEPAPT